MENQHESPAPTPPRKPKQVLKAKPIMIYPDSPEQRDEFQEYATREGRSMNNFIVVTIQNYINEKKAASRS